MARAEVYRNIDRRQQWAGVEPIDAVVLGAVLWLLMSLNGGAFAINLLAVATCYVGVRLAKRGKPDGYTKELLRFLLADRAFLSAAEPDVDGRSHPFHPTSR